MSSNQLDFKPNLGKDALHSRYYNIYIYINKALYDGRKPLDIFLDLAKAFDMVNHIELMKILTDFGMKNVCLKRFNRYLTNRSQAVKIDGVFNNPL